MGGKEDADLIKSRNGSSRTRRPYLAHLCPVHHGMVVYFILSASDTVAIGTKLPATLLPILGHLLLCYEKQHPCSRFKRYSFVRLFNATSNLLSDHRKPEPIISSCQADSMTCRKSWVEGSLEVGRSALCRAMLIGCLSAVPAGLRGDPNSDLPQE